MSGTTTTPPHPNPNRLNFAERTGRLVLIITVLGILGVGYSKAFLFAFNNLADKIYMPYIISHEHIIAACMLSTALLVLVHAIWYCYCEFSALNYTNRDDSDSEAIRNISKADIAYGTVFKASPLYFTLSTIAILLFSIVFGIIAGNILVIYALPILVAIFFVFLFFKKFRQEVLKGLLLLKRYIVSNWGNLTLWGSITLAILMYLVIAMSVVHNLVFTAKFSNENSAPILLNFENTVPEKVTVKFYSVDKENNEQLTKEITITESQFKRSFIEVTEKPISTEKRSFITLLDNEMRKGAEAYVSRKSHYNYSYDINARDNLRQGKNFIVIQFNTGTFNNEEYYKIVNQIDLYNNGTLVINTTQFQEKLKR